MTVARHHDLRAEGLTLAYGEREVVHDLTLAIPDGQVTAVVGPIAFVAFVAGPLARRAVGTGEPVLGVAAAVGAVVVVAADVVGQHLVPGVRVPVGIVTALVGGPYLLWLLRTGGRTTRGGTDR